MIYTTYFAKVKNLPKEIIPIAICGKSPDWWTGAEYKVLAPKLVDFMQWKNDHNNELYIVNYYNHVLCNLDPDAVINDLFKISSNKEFALICYEKREDFCHRHIVRKWLKDFGGKEIKEYED